MKSMACRLENKNNADFSVIFIARVLTASDSGNERGIRNRTGE